MKMLATNRSKGTALAVLSALFYSLISACVKWIGGALPTMEIVFFRAFVMLVLVAGPMAIRRQRPCNKHRALLILRGLSGAMGAFTYYAAVASAPLAETMALVNLSPFVVTVLAAIFLKESCGKRHIAALLVSFTGALCIIRPSFHTLNTGYLIAFASAVITGCSYTLVRKLKQDVDTQTIVFYYCAVSVLFSLVFMGISGFVWPSGLDWFKLVCLGVVAQLFNWANTSAYKYAPAGKIAIFSYMSIFCSALLGIVLWNEYLIIGTVLGILLIFSGACLSFYGDGSGDGSGEAAEEAAERVSADGQ